MTNAVAGHLSQFEIICNESQLTDLKAFHELQAHISPDWSTVIIIGADTFLHSFQVAVNRAGCNNESPECLPHLLSAVINLSLKILLKEWSSQNIRPQMWMENLCFLSEIRTHQMQLNAVGACYGHYSSAEDDIGGAYMFCCRRNKRLVDD